MYMTTAAFYSMHFTFCSYFIYFLLINFWQHFVALSVKSTVMPQSAKTVRKILNFAYLLTHY